MANYHSLFITLLLLSSIFATTVFSTSRNPSNCDLLIRQVADGSDYHNLFLTHSLNKFEEFKAKYNKEYETEEENEYRFGVFVSNLVRARRHQEIDPDAKHGVTRFSDLTPQEFTSKLNSPPDFPVSILNAPILEVNDIPSQKDWRQSGAVTRVKDQFKAACNAGWAFSTAGLLESRHFLETNQLMDLSAQQLLDCDSACSPAGTDCNKGCSGGYTYMALDYIKSAGGLMSDYDYPYSGTDSNACQFDATKAIQKINKIYHIRNNEEQIAAYVAKKNPVVVFVNAQYLQSYQSGVYCPSQCGSVGNHGALVVGYDNGRNWTIKNSWGTEWGENGYFRACQGYLTCKNQLDPIGLTMT